MAKAKGEPDIDKAMAKLAKKVQLMRKQHAALERKVAKLRAGKLPWLKDRKDP